MAKAVTVLRARTTTGVMRPRANAWELRALGERERVLPPRPFRAPYRFPPGRNSWKGGVDSNSLSDETRTRMCERGAIDAQSGRRGAVVRSSSRTRAASMPARLQSFDYAASVERATPG